MPLRMRRVGLGGLEALDDRSERGPQPLPQGVEPAQGRPDRVGVPGHHPGNDGRLRGAEAGANPLQAVSGRLYQVRGRV
jgi:hypothetical protein